MNSTITRITPNTSYETESSLTLSDYWSSDFDDEDTDDEINVDGCIKTTNAASFICTNCTDYALPPILQCPRGHLICTNCRDQICMCPKCNNVLKDSRNISMELLARYIPFPCKYAANNCTAQLNWVQKPDHELNCIYRMCACPCLDTLCSWRCLYSDTENLLVPHILQEHTSIKLYQGNPMQYVVDNFKSMKILSYIQQFEEKYFMVTAGVQRKIGGRSQFWIGVQLIGTEDEADQYYFKIVVYKQQKRMIWEAITESIQADPISKILKKRCMLLTDDGIDQFETDGKITFQLTISKI